MYTIPFVLPVTSSEYEKFVLRDYPAISLVAVQKLSDILFEPSTESTEDICLPLQRIHDKNLAQTMKC
jgi:hypothetical protein